MRQEVGVGEGTEIIEKRGMVVWKIKVGKDPASSVHVNTGIDPFPENHVDARTAPILESHINVGIVHVHTDMPTEVRIP